MSGIGRQPLKALLRLRRHREDRSRQTLVAARGDLTALRRQISLLRESMAECNAAARQSLLESGNVPDMAIYRRRISEMRKVLCSQSTAATAAEGVVAQRRLELAHAIKHRRALQRLDREKAAVEAVRRGRRQQKELDESFAAHQAAEIGGQSP